MIVDVGYAWIFLTQRALKSKEPLRLRDDFFDAERAKEQRAAVATR
jgi:hypothetical protein